MRVSSLKAKGRRCAAETKDLLLGYAPTLQNDDIVVTSSGSTGVDVQLSPAAQTIYKLAIECKNQEALNIWAALAQAKGHVAPGSDLKPVVFFRRNKSEMFVALVAEDFLKLITK